ncbi:MAG: VWA domain-containing protein [Planctomycetaceae bacterium]
MVAELALCAVLLLAAGAELLHARRVRAVAPLVFGPRRRPAVWVRASAVVRVACLGALAWGLTTLLVLPPAVHRAEAADESATKHLLIALDVSPSMRLQDAGPTGEQSRTSRASDLLESFFQRVPVRQYRQSVVAFYTGAIPVVKETRDLEVVRNILDDLPLHYAFQAGETDLFAGLEEAGKLAHGWPPRSATLLVVSDGDTVPATGMPKLPASIDHVVVVGVGDPLTGRFIDGRHSRQDSSTLRQVAVRLGGVYHDGNRKHLPSTLLRELTQSVADEEFERLTRREYALLATASGAAGYALLPLLLHAFGTMYRPGVRRVRESREREYARLPAGRTIGFRPGETSIGSTIPTIDGHR